MDGGDPYAIPDDNPYVGQEGARGEIWAIGVRNPWRSTFDPGGDALYVADVGQNAREELNAVPAGAAGINYGWNTMEGSACYGSSTCDMSGLTLPVLEYGHDGGACSVTGGYVYRGSQLAEIVGHYFYSDFCTGFLRSFRLDGGQATDERSWDVGSLARCPRSASTGRANSTWWTSPARWPGWSAANPDSGGRRPWQRGRQSPSVTPT